MFDFLFSPFAKLFGIGILAVGLIGFGYYKGYSSEHEKFLAYKAEIAAQVKAQDALNQSIAKQQQIKTEGIVNEYKARLMALRSVSNRMQYNNGTLQLPETTGTQGTFTAPSYPVLVGQCLETTLMLTSLQEWAKFVSE
jgi:hypothetical protein